MCCFTCYSKLVHDCPHDEESEVGELIDDLFLFPDVDGPPDVPVAPVAPPPPIVVEGRDAPTVEIVSPFGIIRYYEKHKRFEATCPRFDHVSGGKPCRLTRYSTANKNLAKGRPLGFMLAWLEAGRHMADHHEHIHPLALASLGLADRIRCRGLINAMPCGPAMLDKERPRRAGEPVEPMGDP
jgi:hypothetical protein